MEYGNRYSNFECHFHFEENYTKFLLSCGSTETHYDITCCLSTRISITLAVIYEQSASTIWYMYVEWIKCV